jgi:hypothetical protein
MIGLSTTADRIHGQNSRADQTRATNRSGPEGSAQSISRGRAGRSKWSGFRAGCSAGQAGQSASAVLSASGAAIYFMASTSLRASLARWRNRRFALGSAAASASPSSSRARVFSVLRSRAAGEGAGVPFAGMSASNLIRSSTPQGLDGGFLRPPPCQAFEVAPHLRIARDLRDPRAVSRFGEAFLGVRYHLLLLGRPHEKQTAEPTRGFLPDPCHAVNPAPQSHAQGALPRDRTSTSPSASTRVRGM